MLVVGAAPGPGVEGVVRIGDGWHSASPQLGQGANMALRDACALARALREGEGVGTAAARGVRLRRRHVWIDQAMSAPFMPAHQSDSVVLPVLRDRVVGALNDAGGWGAVAAVGVEVAVSWFGGRGSRYGLRDSPRMVARRVGFSLRMSVTVTVDMEGDEAGTIGTVATKARLLVEPQADKTRVRRRARQVGHSRVFAAVGRPGVGAMLPRSTPLD